jgi:glycosyltransferase involved in cell wall biosynthesis
VTAGLRIVHCFRAPVGGVFRHVRDLAAAQAAAGHQVGFICDSTTGGALEDRYFEAVSGALALGVTRMKIGRDIGPGDIAAGWRTYRLVKKLQPDVLHGHGAKGGALARVFGSALRVSRFRVARLYSPHGGVLHFDPATAKGKALFAAERIMDRMTDRVLFVSQFERDSFAQKIGGPNAPAEVIHNGVQPAEFEPVAPRPDAADFLYIGEMRALKGTDIFIDALDRASKALARPLTAVMVGSGETQTYAAQVARLGLGERVKLLPPMPARQAFALARFVVVPSRAEAMPYIVLEALAAGRPMIAAKVGGIPEIFGPSSPALVAAEVDAVASAMEAAISDEAAHAALMPAAADLQTRFGVAAMAARVEHAYRQALSG